MSISPAFLDELRARVPVSRIVGRKVTWDLRRSNQAKGDWWSPCPFHGEKTASFHVDAQKGFYYCFGCHAKGDALTFLREAERRNVLLEGGGEAHDARLAGDDDRSVRACRLGLGARSTAALKQARIKWRDGPRAADGGCGIDGHGATPCLSEGQNGDPAKVLRVPEIFCRLLTANRCRYRR